MTITMVRPAASADRLGAHRDRWRLAVVVALATISVTASLTACTSDTETEPTPAASPSAQATALTGPGRGTGYFGGSEPEVPVTYDMPAGWQSDGVFVLKTGGPVMGLVFSDVWNIYADGCRWQLMDPPVGPTVDDLVAAYATLPGFDPTVRDVTVDGHAGKQVQLVIPDYDATDCRDGQFGILQDGNGPSSDDAPHLWAQAPGQVNAMWILDVDGTRLQILSGYPPGTPEQDRTEMDQMVASIEIG